MALLPKTTAIKLIALGFLAVGAGLSLYGARDDLRPSFTRFVMSEDRWFEPVAPPMRRMPHLFDLGVVDANGDGGLDVYTANHNYRQVLLLTNGGDEHRDVLTDWGLDQNRDFPGWEQSFDAPTMEGPGLYIYWFGETLCLRAVGLAGGTRTEGVIGMFSEISVGANNGFELKRESITVSDSPIVETVMKFSAKGDAQLDLFPLSRGVPTRIELGPSVPLSRVYVGSQGSSPTSHVFSPFLRDRHGLAWADYNDDGQLDVFISRGGVGGLIRKLPEALRRDIRDELLVKSDGPHFKDVTMEAGIEKKDCSGRHVEWVDFDGDGRLDLFVNCQDRGKSAGIFPKQLWQQGPDRRFRDVAMDVGLGLPDHELIDFVWTDADGDGDFDLLSTEAEGFFVYRNELGKFTPQLIFRPDFMRADVAGLKSEVNNYWRFDGKLTVADFDADGDIDVFSSSKRGNALLVNEEGTYGRVDPVSVGLPSRSLNAVWVDHDDDGLQDLYTVPDGLYRQTQRGRFEATGLLTLPKNLYQAAIVHWYDHDNDGRRDLLVALNENPSLWRWWQRPFRTVDDAHSWTLHAWRNKMESNHWLQIEVAGLPANRQAIGARVTVTTADGIQTQEVGGTDSSFFSQGHYRLYFGLGTSQEADSVRVRWPDGRATILTGVAADRLLRIDPTTSSN